MTTTGVEDAPDFVIESDDLPPDHEVWAKEDDDNRKKFGWLTGDESPKTPQPVPPKPRVGSLVKPLTDLHVAVGMMVLPFDQVCGMPWINCAESCAKALEAAARESPSVRRVVMGLVETSIWGQIIAAYTPIIATVAAHHSKRFALVMDQMSTTAPSDEGETINPVSNG